MNGPPRSGKDTSAEILVRVTPRVVEHLKFASTLKQMTHRLYGVTDLFGVSESEKDTPNSLFYGATPRQAYIAVSETLMKPLHGRDFFGQALLRQMRGLPHAHAYVVSDSGFAEEAVPIIREFGAENCLQVRLNRRGTSFAGDSRSHWTLDSVRSIEIWNSTDDLEVLEQVLQPVVHWIKHGRLFP